MEFTCNTAYDQKAATAMARAVRKTVRAKRARRLQLFAWIVAVANLLCVFTSWGRPVWVTMHMAVAVLLLLIGWKQDAINGYSARRKMLPGVKTAETVFHEDSYDIHLTGAIGHWEYSRAMALAETKDYFVIVLGENLAQVFEKEGLEGGTVEAFHDFLEKKTGKKIQNVGG